MCSNEFWAKFRQKPNKVKIDLNRWYNILTDDKLEILNRVVFFSDKYLHQTLDLRFYVLNKLDDQVVIFDTDSVFSS